MLKTLEYIAGIKINRVKKLPPLHTAVKEGNMSGVIIYLYKKYDINEQDIYGKTPLHYAYETGNTEIIETLLIRSEIKVNIKDNYGHTPKDLTCSTISLQDEVSTAGEALDYEGSADL